MSRGWTRTGKRGRKAAKKKKREFKNIIDKILDIERHIFSSGVMKMTPRTSLARHGRTLKFEKYILRSVLRNRSVIDAGVSRQLEIDLFFITLTGLFVDMYLGWTI